MGGRVDAVLRAAKQFVRRPRATLLLAAQLEAGNGRAVGNILQAELPRDECLIAATRLASPDQLIITFERDGLTWTTDLGDEIGMSLYRTGSYEKAEIDALVLYFADERPPGRFPVVVDIGAHVGTTSIPLAQAGYDVTAVEPIPSTFAMLRANVMRNAFGDRIRCVRKAVWSEPGPLSLWVTSSSGLSTVAAENRTPSFSRLDEYPLVATVEVEAVRLDDLVDDPTAVAFVWCDTEGAEADVLQSGTQLWSVGVPLYTEITRNEGSTRFVDVAMRTFRGFLSRDDLVRGLNSTRPVDELRGFVEAIESGYTNLLLLP